LQRSKKIRSRQPFVDAVFPGMDPSKMDAVSWMRAMVVFFDYQFLINYKDKTGTVAILDFSGANFESFDAVMPLDVVSEWCQILAVSVSVQIYA
jgi:hypothetical protein